MTDERLRELYQHALAARTRAGSARGQCPSPEALLALARREGAESARLATLDHAMACEACRGELELLRAIEAAGRQRPPARRRFPVPLAVAASALLAVGVGVSALKGRDAGDSDVARGGEGAPLALLLPAATASVAPGAPIGFAWRPVPGARRYQLELLDAAGRPVLAESTGDTVATLRDTGALAAGAEYRWWVRVVDAAGRQPVSPLRRLRVRSQ